MTSPGQCCGEKWSHETGEEYSANWHYNKALMEYKLKNKPLADHYLQEALLFNPYFADYLLGKKSLPFIPPSYYSRGEDNEAQIYAVSESKAPITLYRL